MLAGGLSVFHCGRLKSVWMGRLCCKINFHLLKKLAHHFFTMVGMKDVGVSQINHFCFSKVPRKIPSGEKIATFRCKLLIRLPAGNKASFYNLLYHDWPSSHCRIYSSKIAPKTCSTVPFNSIVWKA